MAPVTEIASLPLTAGSDLQDPHSSSYAVWHSALDTVSSQDGFQRFYWGLKVEAPNEVVMLIDWDSISSHRDFQASPAFAPFETHLSALLSGPASIHHASLSPHTPAPVTECLTLYYPLSTSPSAHLEKWDKFRASLEQHAAGYKSASAGWVVEELEHEGEKCKAFAVFVGWESVEAHMKYRETEAFKGSIGLMREGAKMIKVFHVALLEK